MTEIVKKMPTAEKLALLNAEVERTNAMSLRIGNAYVPYGIANKKLGIPESWALPGGGRTNDPVHALTVAQRIDQIMSGAK